MNWSVYVINGFISTGILIVPIIFSLLQFVRTREKAQLYLALLWIFYAFWIFFQSLSTLLLNIPLFLFLGTYSMIGILIFVIFSGDNIVRGKEDWRKIPFIIIIIIFFIATTFNINYLTLVPSIEAIPPQGFLILENLLPAVGSTYGMGYNIMFMSFSFALFYYMALIKINLSSQDKKISNYVIMGGIILGLLPHLASIVFSGYPPFILSIMGVERLLYFPGFEFLLVAIGTLIISYTFKKEPKLKIMASRPEQ